MSCEQSVWEAWWLKYLQANVLYTLYAAHQEGYAVDHREVGYHHKQKGVSLCRSTVQHWQEERELDNLPLSPDIIGQSEGWRIRQFTLMIPPPQIYSSRQPTSWEVTISRRSSPGQL